MCVSYSQQEGERVSVSKKKKKSNRWWDRASKSWKKLDESVESGNINNILVFPAGFLQTMGVDLGPLPPPSGPHPLTGAPPPDQSPQRKFDMLKYYCIDLVD